MVVYVEYVLIDNFIIDLLLLKATLKITGTITTKGRIVFGAVFGAMSSLLFPLISLNSKLLTAIKLLFGILILIVSTRYKSIKHFFVNLAVFLCLTFLLGGGIYAFLSLFSLSVNETFLALIIIPAYLLLKSIIEVINYIYKRKGVESLTYQITLIFNKKEIKTLGFLDTGNSLYDGDKPVIFVSKSLARQFISIEKMPIMNYITVATVLGKKRE